MAGCGCPELNKTLARRESGRAVRLFLSKIGIQIANITKYRNRAARHYHGGCGGHRPRVTRVKSIQPEPVDTAMQRVRSEAGIAVRASEVPMRRLGTTEELARLVLFLLSDGSVYMTGAELAIDGGTSL